MKSIICIVWGISCACLAQDQIIFTKAFTQTLQHYGLEIHLPDSAWYKVSGRTTDEYYTYDLIIESLEEDMEIRYRIEPIQAAGQSPGLRFSAQLATLASNAESAHLGLKVMTSTYIKHRCQAEWASLASFAPKPTLSLKKHAKLLSFYYADKGWITTLVLFNDQYKLAEERVWSLAFKKD